MILQLLFIFAKLMNIKNIKKIMYFIDVSYFIILLYGIFYFINKKIIFFAIILLFITIITRIIYKKCLIINEENSLLSIIGTYLLLFIYLYKFLKT